MTFLQLIIMRLWFGRFRRVFEYFLRKILINPRKIYFGDMKGNYFKGGLSQILGVYYPNVQDALKKNLFSGAVFYDLGANNGFFSLFGSILVGKSGKVFAFEPFKENLETVSRLVETNNIMNCTVVDSAVADYNGTGMLYFADNAATPTFQKDYSNDFVDVNIITLDHFTTNHPRPNVIKVNVEGAEAMVLDGSTKLLNQHQNLVWVIEIHDLENEKKCKNIFKKNGYKVRKLWSPRKFSKKFPYQIIAQKEVIVK